MLSHHKSIRRQVSFSKPTTKQHTNSNEQLKRMLVDLILTSRSNELTIDTVCILTLVEELTNKTAYACKHINQIYFLRQHRNVLHVALLLLLDKREYEYKVSVST